MDIINIKKAPPRFDNKPWSFEDSNGQLIIASVNVQSKRRTHHV